MTYLSNLSPVQRIMAALVVVLTLTAGIYSGVLQQRVVNPLLAPLDSKASAALQRSLMLSSASFATARLIDRAIAFVSEAEVSVGVASVKPGQLLKPLQDMAVRYSDLMVVAMTSVGMQLFLLEFGKVAALPLFGGGALLCFVALIFGPASTRRTISYLLRCFIALLLVIRIGIPLAAFAVAGLSDWVLEPKRVAAESVLTQATAQLQQDTVLPDNDSGTLGWLKQTANSASEMFSAVRAFTDNLVERLVQLIVVYSLQTLVFPLLSLWLLWHLGRWFVRSTPQVTALPQQASPAL